MKFRKRRRHTKRGKFKKFLNIKLRKGKRKRHYRISRGGIMLG